MSAKKKSAEAKSAKAKAKRAPADVPTALLDRLVREAKAARKNAYAPYSRYLVGAAIATKSGKIFVGANVENASYGAGICAERSAIATMISAGERDPIACAVVTDDEGAAPCGICRQVLAEFAADMPIVMVGLGGRGKAADEAGRVVQLDDLLPLRFVLAR